MFQLHLVNRDGTSLKNRILVKDGITNDFLANAYTLAFQEQFENDPQLVSRTFLATPRHQITKGFLEQLSQQVQEQVVVRKVGTHRVKFKYRGRDEIQVGRGR